MSQVVNVSLRKKKKPPSKLNIKKSRHKSIYNTQKIQNHRPVGAALMQTEKRYLLLERSVDVIIPFWNKKVLYYIVLYSMY